MKTKYTDWVEKNERKKNRKLNDIKNTSLNAVKGEKRTHEKPSTLNVMLWQSNNMYEIIGFDVNLVTQAIFFLSALFMCCIESEVKKKTLTENTILHHCGKELRQSYT